MTFANPFPSKPRIAIVGSGAVGTYYGSRLAEHGHDVHFHMRSDCAYVKEHGLRISSVKGDIHLPNVPCSDRTEEIGPCDLVIVALKSTANEALLQLIPPLLHENTLLLTLQNGLGNEEYLAEHFGAQRVLGGLCFVCINRTSPGVIEHLAQGQISMGEFQGFPQERTYAIAKLLQSSNIDCRVEENLMSARWRKLVWNIPFNGLSIAAGSLDTEEILANEDLVQLVKSLMQEVIEAANVQGFELPLSLIEKMVSETRTMKGYKTSSLLDFVDGREVELEAIWGEPCRRALTAGARMKQVEMLFHLLKHRVTQRKSA